MLHLSLAISSNFAASCIGLTWRLSCFLARIENACTFAAKAQAAVHSEPNCYQQLDQIHCSYSHLHMTLAFVFLARCCYQRPIERNNTIPAAPAAPQLSPAFGHTTLLPLRTTLQMHDSPNAEQTNGLHQSKCAPATWPGGSLFSRIYLNGPYSFPMIGSVFCAGTNLEAQICKREGLTWNCPIPYSRP